jgi:hypothetical protein
VGWWPTVANQQNLPQPTSPPSSRGIFAFGENNSFGAVRDGSTFTILAGEVTAVGFYSSKEGNLTGAIPGFTLPVHPVQPYNTPASTGRGPNTPVALCNTGVSRSLLSTNPQYVFRSTMVATGVNESVTGGPYTQTFYSPCCGGAGATGWDVEVNAGGILQYAYPPTFNGAFGPNSEWPGMGAHHPGGPQAVMADASVRTISMNIDYRVYAALCTRIGGEAHGDRDQ